MREGKPICQAAIPCAPKETTKILGKNRYLGEDELSASQMKKSQVVFELLIPVHQEATRAIEPGMGAFHDPATLPPDTVFWFCVLAIAHSFRDSLV